MLSHHQVLRFFRYFYPCFYPPQTFALRSATDRRLTPAIDNPYASPTPTVLRYRKLPFGAKYSASDGNLVAPRMSREPSRVACCTGRSYGHLDAYLRGEGQSGE